MNIDRILRSHRKTVALYVRDDGSLEVRAPLRLSKAVIQAFVDSKTDWIVRQQSKLRSTSSSRKNFGYAKRARLWLLGQALNLEYSADKLRQIKVEGNNLVVPARLQPTIESALIAWYRNEARRIITARVDSFASLNGFCHSGVRINSARTRWGSCGSGNHLNFPYRLVMAPLKIIDYVVVHELVHTAVRNHGPAFWARLAIILPDYRVLRKWLRVNGRLLDLSLEADPDQIIPIPQQRTRRKPAPPYK